MRFRVVGSDLVARIRQKVHPSIEKSCAGISQPRGHTTVRSGQQPSVSVPNSFQLSWDSEDGQWAHHGRHPDQMDGSCSVVGVAHPINATIQEDDVGAFAQLAGKDIPHFALELIKTCWMSALSRENGGV